MTALRLDRLLSNLGYGSRADVKIMIHRGRVGIDGTVERREATKVEAERVSVDHEPLDHPGRLLIAMNKPVDYSCSHDEREEPLIFGLLPTRWQYRNPVVESVGRLDRDTSGLILLTDDHQLLHRLSSPKHHVEKQYIAELSNDATPELVETFGSGKLMLERETTPCLPAVAEILSERTVSVTLTEGRYHQVRRMFAAVGSHVDELARVRIGEIELDGLAPAEFRLIDADLLA